MFFRVSKWVGTPKRGYVVLGDLPVEATEQDLVEAFGEHLPCSFQVQLYDPDTKKVSRTFSIEVAGRSPLEQLAEVARTWAPLQDVGKLRSWKKHLLKYLDEEVQSMFSRPRTYAQSPETLAFGILQNRLYVEQLTGRRRHLTRDLHAFGAKKTNRPGPTWWHHHANATLDEAVEVLKEWVKEIEP